MTDTAWKSGIRRGSPRWPIRISVWTEPGRWTTWTSRPVDGGRCRRRAGRRRRRRRTRVHAAEQPLGERRPRPGRRGRRRRRASPGAGSSVARVGAAQVLAASGRSTVSRVPAGRSVVRRRPARRSSPTKASLGAAARIGLGLEQVVEPLVAQALDLARREGRVAAGPRRRARAPAPAGRPGTSTPTLERVPAGLGVDARRRAARRPRRARSRRSARVPSVSARAARTVRRPRRPARRRRPRARPRDAETSGRPGRSAIEDRQPVRRAGSRRHGRELVGARGARAAAARRRRVVAAGRASCSCRRLLVRRRRLVGVVPERHVVGGRALRAGRSGRAGCPAGRRPRRRRGSPPASPPGSAAASR